VELTGRVKATRPFAFLFGALGIAYALQQRNLRRAVEARLARRIPELQPPAMNSLSEQRSFTHSSPSR